MKTTGEKISKYFKYTDRLLWLLIIALNTLSLLLIASMQRAGEYNYLRTQSIALCIGIAGAFALSVIDYKFLRKFWWLAATAGIGLIGIVFIYGIRVEGTDDVAWINVGGFSLQPSEIVKVCFIVTLSAHLSALMKSGKITDFFNVCLLAVHGAVPALLIHFQGDDGSALIFVLIFAVMTFCAGVQLRYYLGVAAAAALSIPFVWTRVLNNDQRNRFMVLLNLDENAKSVYGWQQYQGKLSIVSGGYKGEGLFQGKRVGYAIVPEQENDFIFTVAGEELGFIGCCIILLLFLVLVLRIFYKSANARDEFGQNLCIGVFALILSQVSVNLGMVLGFLPVVGVTLPFFSAGGTSLMVLMFCMGIVQSVHYYSSDERLIIKPHNDD
ncbi:MAG: rod shape-determining protein RodA [Clostridia bacterium]|nr:rod shape-determining protein RodA [Clostridia bacterium]MBQ5440160.1 rod shape-determining protein RodA [Clostridia bacterium]